MNPFQFAMRVLRGDRRTRTSALLTAIGVAVATGLVLLLATLPYATEAREQRSLWQRSGHYESGAQSALLINTTKDYFDGALITRVDLAVTGQADTLRLPPGIPRLPGPGESIVSPALGKLLAGTPADQLGNRFGKPVASFGDDALRFPEQLAVLVGHAPAEMKPPTGSGEMFSPHGIPVSAFPTGQGHPDRLLTVLSWVGIIVLLVPSLVLVASSARLTAARREQRLAALRLAGATPGQVTAMVAAETGVSAVSGALLGLLVSPLLRGLASFVPWDGGTWMSSDFSLPIPLTVLSVLAVPVLVVLAGVLGLRRVVRTPLFATGGHTVKPLHWWRLLALPAAGLFFLYSVYGPRGTSGSLAIVGLALVVGSAMLVGPWVTSAVGGTFVRMWRRPSSLLAGRRLRNDPKGAYRATAGIVLAVFTGSMALTLLPSFYALAGGGRDYVDSALYLDVSPDQAASSVERANATLAKAGVGERVVPVASVYLGQGQGQSQAMQRAYVMTCADAAKLTRLGITAQDCKPGVSLYSPYQLDTTKLSVAQFGSSEGAPVPLHDVTTGTYRPDQHRGGYVLDPSALPAGLKPTYVTMVVPTVDADREIVRTALAPYSIGNEIGSRDQYLYGQQVQLDDLRRVTVIGLIAAGILAGCSAAVATAGSVMDRRRTFGALMAAGTPVRVLSRALRMEAALPALVVTIGAGVMGALVGLGLFLSTMEAGSVVFSPWIAAPIVLGVGVALIGASICTPALKRVQAEPLADE